MLDFDEIEPVETLCGRLLARRGEVADEQRFVAAPELAGEVARRLAAVGVRLHRQPETAPLCVIEEDDEALSELSRACLGYAKLALQEGGGKRARLSLDEIWEKVGKPGGYSKPYLRRSALGPLEQRGLLKVVSPEQRVSDAYLVAGPALAAIDGGRLRSRLDALAESAR